MSRRIAWSPYVQVINILSSVGQQGSFYMNANLLGIEYMESQFSGLWLKHYGDVIMDAIASQITSLTIVYSTVYSDADQRKHQSSPSLAFVRGIHRGPVNSPHKWPVTRKMFPFDDVIMNMNIFSPGNAFGNIIWKSRLLYLGFMC